MIKIDGVELNIDEDLVQRYQRLMGDSDELLLEIFKHMVTIQSGLEYHDAVSKYFPEELTKMIETQIQTELSGFWEA